MYHKKVYIYILYIYIYKRIYILYMYIYKRIYIYISIHKYASICRVLQIDVFKEAGRLDLRKRCDKSMYYIEICKDQSIKANGHECVSHECAYCPHDTWEMDLNRYILYINKYIYI